MRIFLSEGNSKLEKTGKAMGKKIVAWNLPPDHVFYTADGTKQNTCPGALACRAVCYAKQGRLAMPNAVARRMENLQATQSPDFVPSFLSAVIDSGADIVRIHDSGDFYSQQYLNAFFLIAKCLPAVTFYAYTKSLHLDWSKCPENLRRVQSEGGRHDDKIDRDLPHSRIFATHYQRRQAGYIDGGGTDRAAINGLVQIGLVYHGTKKLTDAQRDYFSA